MQHPNHPDHDLSLVAAHAAGDLANSERTRAEAQIDTCGECADLHRDLIAIAAATRTLPNLTTAPRDFRLTPDQAARLVKRGWLRTVLAPFGATRSAARPMAAAFTSLGLAGLLVATFLPGLMGSAASAPTNESRDQAAVGGGPTAAPAAPAATSAPLVPAAAGGQPAPNATSNPDDAYAVKNRGGATGAAGATGAPEIAVAGGTPTQAPSAADLGARADALTTTATNPLLIGSFALLAVGLLLFGLRFASRRLR